jgi:hypothetical protein
LRLSQRASTTFCFAAGQGGDEIGIALGLDRELADHLARFRLFPAVIVPPSIPVTRQLPDREIFSDRQALEHAAMFAGLRNMGDAALHGLLRLSESAGNAGHADLSAVHRMSAKNHAKKLGAPRPEQSSDAKNLAGIGFETYVHERPPAQPRYFKDGRSAFGCRPFDFAMANGEDSVERPANNLFDQIGFRHSGDGARGDMISVTQHGYRIGDLENLIEAMADIENRVPMSGEPPHGIEEDLNFVVGK